MAACQKWIVGAVVASMAVMAGADDLSDLKTSMKALKMKLRDQERRLAEIEDQQGKFLDFMKEERTGGAGGPNDFRVFWKEGLRFESGDGNFKLKIGGRVMADVGYMDGSGIESDLGTDAQDGAEFRRARLYMSGEIYRNVGYKVQVDFADEDVALKDIYMQVKDLPAVGTLTVGKHKMPVGLEELTSSKYITFLERALPSVFVPSRQWGMSLKNSALDDKLFWQVGAYRLASAEQTSDGGYNFAARVAWAPINENKGEKLLHIGGSYALQYIEDAAGGSVRLRQRPEYHNTSIRLVDTGNLTDIEWQQVYGLELAGTYGPFHASGEFIGSTLEGQSNADSYTFCGYYVQAGYFLTGEHRPYKKGTFSRVKPKENFKSDFSGLGAWEIAARYSYLDLQDGLANADAGQEHNVTVGLNWYLNPNARIMLNYIRACADTRATSNAADIAAVRFQVDF
ncbi:MAG: OprO/OprP family phosphate-selective porin [Phycisphaerae bacterium]